jgi:hypothetical protein
MSIHIFYDRQYSLNLSVPDVNTTCRSAQWFISKKQCRIRPIFLNRNKLGGYHILGSTFSLQSFDTLRVPQHSAKL